MTNLQTKLYIPLLGLTLVVSAALMFVIEPVAAKMVLPLLGGSSYVWNTCVVFFQSVLLSAYVYVFLLNEFSFKLKVKLFIQVIIVWLPIFTLPLRPPIEEPWLNHPYLWLMYSLVSLLVQFSLPFQPPRQWSKIGYRPRHYLKQETLISFMP